MKRTMKTKVIILILGIILGIGMTVLSQDVARYELEKVETVSK